MLKVRHLNKVMQYNNGIPKDSRYANHPEFFKARAEKLNSPEGQEEIRKVRELTKLAEEGEEHYPAYSASSSDRPRM